MANSSTGHKQRLAASIESVGTQPAVAIAQSQALVNKILQNNLAEKDSEKTFGRRLRQISEQAVDKLSVLPLLTCETAGGDPYQAIPLMAAWQFLRLSAKLLDDVADSESMYPPAEAVGLATGFFFLAPLALKELQNHGVSASRIKPLTRSLHQAGLRACAGQYAEFTSPNRIDPDGWLAVARAKSGDPCAWAAWAGAVIARAKKQTLDKFHNFGLHLGILLQVADDFNGIWGATKSSDLSGEQLNLAVCYARLVAEGEQKLRLEALLKNTIRGDDTTESEIRQLLIEMGSQAYLLAVGGEHRQQALAALQRNYRTYPLLVNMLDQIWPILGEVQTDGSCHDEQT